MPCGFFDKEDIESGKITLSTCAVTEPGGLVRIDDHLLDGMPERLIFEERLTLRLNQSCKSG